MFFECVPAKKLSLIVERRCNRHSLKIGKHINMKEFFVYIITNKYQGTLYTGVTSNLRQRSYQHKNKLLPGFTKKYGLCKLVYFEQCGDALSAICREKRLKRWKRSWKLELIATFNPAWRDLYQDIISMWSRIFPCGKFRDDVFHDCNFPGWRFLWSQFSGMTFFMIAIFWDDVFYGKTKHVIPDPRNLRAKAAAGDPGSHKNMRMTIYNVR